MTKVQNNKFNFNHAFRVPLAVDFLLSGTVRQRQNFARTSLQDRMVQEYTLAERHTLQLYNKSWQNVQAM